MRELWLIDPEPRIVTIHRFAERGGESVSEVAESGILMTSLLPGFKIPGAPSGCRQTHPRLSSRRAFGA